jgi:hypothetical protein
LSGADADRDAARTPASLAAFRAGRLVCRAISSIFEIELAISFMISTASSTLFAAFLASLALLSAILFVCCALSALRSMFDTISSIEDDAFSAAQSIFSMNRAAD